jgi:hypothetical protein
LADVVYDTKMMEHGDVASVGTSDHRRITTRGVSSEGQQAAASGVGRQRKSTSDGSTKIIAGIWEISTQGTPDMPAASLFTPAAYAASLSFRHSTYDL